MGDVSQQGQRLKGQARDGHALEAPGEDLVEDEHEQARLHVTPGISVSRQSRRCILAV